MCFILVQSTQITLLFLCLQSEENKNASVVSLYTPFAYNMENTEFALIFGMNNVLFPFFNGFSKEKKLFAIVAIMYLLTEPQTLTEHSFRCLRFKTYKRIIT